MATRQIIVPHILSAPALKRDEFQHNKFISLEYGPPQFALPGQELWPIVLRFQREQDVDVEVGITWVAVGVGSTVGTASPQVQEARVGTDCTIKKFLDTQLPRELQLAPERQEQDAPVPLVIVISRLKAPMQDPPRGTPMFRLFIRLYSTLPGQTRPTNLFHACLLCSDKKIDMDHASNCNLTLRFPQRNDAPPSASGGNTNAQIVELLPREPTKMSKCPEISSHPIPRRKKRKVRKKEEKKRFAL